MTSNGQESAPQQRGLHTILPTHAGTSGIVRRPLEIKEQLRENIESLKRSSRRRDRSGWLRQAHSLFSALTIFWRRVVSVSQVFFAFLNVE